MPFPLTRQEGLTCFGPRAFRSGKIAVIEAYFVLSGGGRGMEVPVLHLIKQEEQASDALGTSLP
jgi:hypothetical protein